MSFNDYLTGFSVLLLVIYLRYYKLMILFLYSAILDKKDADFSNLGYVLGLSTGFYLQSVFTLLSITFKSILIDKDVIIIALMLSLILSIFFTQRYSKNDKIQLGIKEKFKTLARKKQIWFGILGISIHIFSFVAASFSSYLFSIS